MKHTMITAAMLRPDPTVHDDLADKQDGQGDEDPDPGHESVDQTAHQRRGHDVQSTDETEELDSQPEGVFQWRKKKVSSHPLTSQRYVGV